MTKTEREKELRKLYKDYYYNDCLEDDNIFYYEESYIDAYLVGDEIITGNFY